MKFATKLSLTISITGITLLAILSIAIYNFSYTAMIESQLSYTNSIAADVSNDVNQLLMEKVKIVKTLANTPLLIKAMEASNAEYSTLSAMERRKHILSLNKKWKSTSEASDQFILDFTNNEVSHFLRRQQEIVKGEFGEIFLTNKDGALVASTGKLSTFAHKTKYWWQGAYNGGAGAIFFDDRGYDESVGGVVLGIVVPIFKDQKFLGILKCNLNILGSVNSLISGVKHKLLGEIQIARSGGLVVLQEGVEPLSTRIHDSIYQNILAENNKATIVSKSGDEFLVGFSEISLTSGDNEWGFGGTFESADHQKGNANESWFVICYRQKNAVLAPIISSLNSTLIVGSIIILVFVAIGMISSQAISIPIIKIRDAAVEIGKGNLHIRINSKASDEIGDLANSFNEMATNLATITEKEQKLAQVTAAVEAEKKISEELKDINSYIDNILKSMVDSLIVLTPQESIQRVNDSLCSLLQYEENELIGKPFAMVIGEGNSAFQKVTFPKLVGEGYIADEKFNLVSKKGIPLQVSISGATIKEEDGKLKSVILVARDMSETISLDEG